MDTFASNFITKKQDLRKQGFQKREYFLREGFYEITYSNQKEHQQSRNKKYLPEIF